jgi:hypothetical protein
MKKAGPAIAGPAFFGRDNGGAAYFLTCATM